MNEQLATQTISDSDDQDSQTLGPEPYQGAYIVAGLERCAARIPALAPDVYQQRVGLLYPLLLVLEAAVKAPPSAGRRDGEDALPQV